MNRVKLNILILFSSIYLITSCMPVGEEKKNSLKFVDSSPGQTPTGPVVSKGTSEEDDDSENDSDPTVESFEQFSSIISSSCMSCHDSGSSFGDFSYLKTKDDWINYGYIIPGKPEESSIFFSLKNNGLVSSGTMPKNQTVLSSEEINLIKNFIIDLANPVDGPIPKGSDSTVPERETVFSCQENVDPQESKTKRLSKVQLKNTINELLIVFLGFQGGNGITQSKLVPLYGNIPDESEDKFQSFELTSATSREVIDASVSIAAKVAEELAIKSSSGSFIAAFKACNINADFYPKECVEKLGRLIFRRPLNQLEVSFILIDIMGLTSLTSKMETATIDEKKEKLELFYATSFLSPQFLYHLEEGLESNNNYYQLTAHELANKLSYHFWNTMPDSTLRGLADNGTLLQESVYKTQVDRLFQSIKSRVGIRNFFTGWWDLTKTENPSPIQRSIAGLHFTEDETLSYFTDMKDEVLEMALYYTWFKPGQLSDLFTSNISFATHQGLAKIYGLNEVWTRSTTYDSAQLKYLTGENYRPGILSRAAFLTSGTLYTRPVIKGYKIRTKILCDTLPTPPANVEEQVLPDTIHMTTRDRYEKSTADASCINCHNKMNPLGFATEDYDSIGRKRELERKYVESTRTDFEELEINTFVELANIYVGDNRSIETSDMLSNFIGESSKVKACISRNYYRYTYGVYEDLNKDGCFLENLRTKIKDGNLQDFFKQVAYEKYFKHKVYIPSEQ